MRRRGPASSRSTGGEHCRFRRRATSGASPIRARGVIPRPYDRSVPIRATFVAHGSAAFDALAEAVGAAKGGDPLVPVTVIVPTNTAGVMARRAIGRRGGATAIDVLTVFRLAELLGSPSLLEEHRKPVSTPVIDLGVKQILRSAPGRYRAVADHASTVVALRDLYREVRLAGPAAPAALARTERGGEPARVLTELGRLLAPAWYDEG